MTPHKITPDKHLALPVGAGRLPMLRAAPRLPNRAKPPYPVSATANPHRS